MYLHSFCVTGKQQAHRAAVALHNLAGGPLLHSYARYDAERGLHWPRAHPDWHTSSVSGNNSSVSGNASPVSGNTSLVTDTSSVGVSAGFVTIISNTVESPLFVDLSARSMIGTCLVFQIWNYGL